MVKAATPGPIDNEVYAEIQKEFFAEYVDTKHCDNKLDYEQFKLFDDLGPTDPFEIMYFRSLLTDYSIHLINLLNQFCTGINRIKAWDKVYQNDSRDFPTRLYILGTLIYPLLMAWVSAPYVGQQRLGFCTINMLNAWLVVHNNKHPEVKSSDYRLGWLRKAEWIETAEKCGIDIGKLDDSFRCIGKTETGKIRHSFVHRYPPNFGYGASQTMVRRVSGDRVSIGLSGNSEFSLSKIVEDLSVEQRLIKESFHMFWSQFSTLSDSM